MKYFYIDNIKFNYILEFDTLDSKNNWKFNAPLIEYCETLGILVPHYCYHKNLSIAGNCRMCLIELKKSPKPVVSCAMNAKSSLAANTEIFTNSPLVKKARENIMEFLLLNHPLDCPICDQGGECDLQDQSLFFGITKKRFYNYKRVVTDKNLGPIVKTVMTRCIHCTRCVRFATEIAGNETLGTFGRGVKTEIGTYIDQIFQSELSGNVIDICPVGALTSKPYPFVGRSWELKKLSSIDPSDGFGVNIQVFLKNNTIVKILPGFTSNVFADSNPWISDKTRFLFDGMFSTNRNINKFLTNNNSRIDLKWNEVFKKLIIILYLIDHLGRHLSKINPFLIVFEETSSIEVTSILMLLQKKYSFFQLRRSSELKISHDFELDLQMSSISNSRLLPLTDTCLLIGTNTRYESPYLNLKLKKRFMKGAFNIFSLGSHTNLTFPTTSLSSNIRKFKTITEGNSFVCTNLKSSQNLLTITNTETLHRKDSNSILDLLNKLNSIFSKNKPLNLLNTSLNSVGISNLNYFKTVSKKDLTYMSGLYFINNNMKTTYAINRLTELKLLTYIQPTSNNIILMEQNNKNLLLNLKENFNVSNYLSLPNNVFFESHGSYMNTEGDLRRTVKLVSSLKNTKDEWQILRKLISSLKTIRFTNNTKYNTKIIFASKNLYGFKNFVNFLYLNTKSLSKFAFYLKNQNQSFMKITALKIKKLKLSNTQVKNWIEDFYLGGYDNYSKDSATMISCSTGLRANSNVFKDIPLYVHKNPYGYVITLSRVRKSS